MLRLALLGTVTLFAATPAVASAQVTQVSVTNLASAAMPSEIPQPPVVVTSRGTCATPLDVPDTCPAGTWPAVDGDWGERVAVAGGDLLELTFDAPVGGVLLGSTSTLPPGLVDPDGHEVSNANAIPGVAAVQADQTGTRWTVQLPEILNARVMNALTFSIVATDAGGAHDFGLALTSPRPSRYGQPCDGNTYFMFRPDGYRPVGCSIGVKGPPPGFDAAPTPTPTAEPAVVPAVTGSPRWTARGLKLSVKLPANTAATVDVRAGKTLLGRAQVKAATATARTVTVPVRASNRHRHAAKLRVRLAATGLQRVDLTLKATHWPRLKILG